MRIPYGNGRFIKAELDVVDIDVPLLIGLDILDEHKLYINNVKNLLVCENPQWSGPVTRKMGHIYYEWGYGTMYTKAELKKIHRHFYHPRPERIFSLMKRANDPQATADTLKLLEDVTESCDVCQRIAKQPGRFRVALPTEDIVFNRLVYLDLMSLDGKSVLHIVCRDTLFSAAIYLDGDNAKDVCTAYMRAWVNPYIGHPKEMHIDRGPCFNSAEWRGYLLATGTKRRDSGIESHNALGAGETYHDFLRRIFNKVKSTNPRMDNVDCLSLAVHAMNCTAGKDGLSPILLVFGVVPPISVGVTILPAQKERMKAMKLARTEMVKALAESRLTTAMRRNVPSATDNDVRIGGRVLFWREDTNRYEGPYLVIAGDHKQLWILINGNMRLISIDKVKAYREEAVDGGLSEQDKNEIDSALDRAITGEVFLSHIHTRFLQIRDKHDGAPVESKDITDVFLSEKLAQDDPRLNSDEFLKAKRQEIDGLISRDTWDVVNAHDIPSDSNIIGGRFVCEIRNANSNMPQAKARFVCQGFRDDMKEYMVHSSPSLRQTSVKMIVSTAALMSFRIASIDFRQAYLQASESMSRTIFVKPKKADHDILGVTEQQLLRLKKPLYGICDSGDYWYDTFNRFTLNDLKLKALKGDMAVFYGKGGECLSGMLGSYVDDCLFAVGPGFEDVLKRCTDTFDAKPVVWDNTDFLGLRVETMKDDDGDRTLQVHQPQHLRNLRQIPAGTTF